jgi:hypothetical protein
MFKAKTFGAVPVYAAPTTSPHSRFRGLGLVRLVTLNCRSAAFRQIFSRSAPSSSAGPPRATVERKL